MNRKHITLAGIAALAATLAPAALAHADSTATVTATCDAVTITAPSDGLLIFSTDAEPPSSIAAGTTLTYRFDQHAAIHYWGLQVIEGQSTLDDQHGTVTGCNVEAYPAPLVDSIGELGAPVLAPAPVVVAVADPPVPAVVAVTDSASLYIASASA